jgi:hypothetical protein
VRTASLELERECFARLNICNQSKSLHDRNKDNFNVQSQSRMFFFHSETNLK